MIIKANYLNDIITSIMNKNVLFIQGGGGKEDYEVDAKLVTSLGEALGEAYTLHYPLLSDESSPDFGRKKQIGKEISLIKGEIILVGHSLGASMLLKYLSESRVQKKIAGIFLIATPFWSGDEDWKQGLKLHEDFGDKIPKNVPIFLYHSQDDDEVPFDHLKIYAQNLPQATLRKITHGGHQLNNDLSLIAKDIKSL
jgi:predicted alpha/beta hydrolase family esterase